MPQLQWFWRLTFDMGLIWPLKPKPVKKATMKVCWVSLFLAVIVLASTVNAGGIMGKGLSKYKQKWYPAQICGSIKPSVAFLTFLFKTHTQSRFASVVLDGVLGPPCPTLHTWRYPCNFNSSFVINVQGKVEGPWRVCVSLELQAFQTKILNLMGETEGNNILPMSGHCFAF